MIILSIEKISPKFAMFTVKTSLLRPVNRQKLALKSLPYWYDLKKIHSKKKIKNVNLNGYLQI